MAEATSSTNDTMKARKAKPCWPAKKLYCLTIANNLTITENSWIFLDFMKPENRNTSIPQSFPGSLILCDFQGVCYR